MYTVAGKNLPGVEEEGGTCPTLGHGLHDLPIHFIFHVISCLNTQDDDPSHPYRPSDLPTLYPELNIYRHVLPVLRLEQQWTPLK